MPDREKVIERLKGLQIVRESVGAMGVFILPDLIREVVELLEESEPHLLTLDEVCGGGECWIEGINGACGYADCEYVGDAVCHDNIEITRIHSFSFVSSENYMRTWRCWDKKPTEEQRKAVKWDA